MLQENLSHARQDPFIAELTIGLRHIEAAIGAVAKEEQLRLRMRLRAAKSERGLHLDLIQRKVRNRGWKERSASEKHLRNTVIAF